MKIETAEYEVIHGKSPFLISAPHVFTHKRPTLTGVFKLGEPYTDTICQNLCRETNSTGIFLTKGVEYDPNFFVLEKNPFKKEIEKICREEKGKKLFLDIHGLSDEHCYDIGIYYLSHFGKSKRIARELRNALDKGQLKGMNIQIFRFLDDDQETLSEFVASKLKIPALQIEVARYIREDEELRNTLVKNFSDFLISY
jgi:hypothetical protein